ncbi:unnamed protein product [Angiostrongylus costaricensis]|uniref:ZP domain-containing protein n=1 Tax=Angiostrongylus costaricensis TaxID=334426 RepID=A0A158PKS1_ANGCS|nr:unnamed protein product [Angiostrongylus costaricensis]
MENTLDLISPPSQRTSEEKTDENGSNRHFKKANTSSSSGASRTSMYNFGPRGNRMKQYQSRGRVVNSGRFAQAPPPYMGRMYGLATPTGVQISTGPPFPGEYYEPQGTMFTPRSIPLLGGKNGGRTTAASGLGESCGGVRRRAKSPTSMPSSCEGSSPQQNRDVEASGGEQTAQDGKENYDSGDVRRTQQSSEESSRCESSRRDRQRFSAVMPASDPRSSALLRILRAENGRVTYPLIYVSETGSISVILTHAIIIEMSIDRCVRVVCHGQFAAPSAKYWQVNNATLKCSAAGTYTIPLKRPSAVSLETLDFSSGHLESDFSLRLFYHEAQTGTQITVSPVGMAVRQTRNGDISVDARPRVIQCSPSVGSMHVRSSHIDMGVQENEKAYVKRGVKRVHVSRSGMVVSDGNCITSMDHFGRIVSTT